MKYTSQEIFDTVVKHLRTQQAKSVALNPDGSAKIKNGTEVCLYRSEDGKMRCAAGAIIADEEYNCSMEQKSIDYVINDYNLLHLLPHYGLLTALQTVHDKYQVEDWEQELENVARKHDLLYTPKEAS